MTTDIGISITSKYFQADSKWMTATARQAHKCRTGIKQTKSKRVFKVLVFSPSDQFLQINPRVQYFARLHNLVPRNLVALVSRRARQYAGNRRLRPFIRLVVKISAGDALHKRLLLLAIGKFQVGREISGNRESLRVRFVLSRRHRRLPGLIAPNSQRSGIRRLRNAIGSKETTGNVPPALGKLRRAECYVYVVRIVEQHIVVSIRVAIGSRPPLPSTCCRR